MFKKKANTLILKDAEVVEKKENVLWMLLNSKKLFGKDAGFLLKDWQPLSKGFGKISLWEYISFRLYRDHISDEEKRRFVSDKAHWTIIDFCSPIGNSQIMCEDKQAIYDHLGANGIAVPETLCVINSKETPYDTSHIECNTPEEFRDFLTSQDNFPIFAKPNFGVGSLGAFVITSANENSVTIAQTGDVSYSELFENFFSDEVYLIQKCVKSHPELLKFSQYLPTVRVANILYEKKTKLHYSLVKIPSPTSVADNYWRDGNVLAEVDQKTGEILKAVTGRGSKTQDIEDHPDTGEKLIGFKLPQWDDVLKINTKTSKLISDIRYQSLDIAISEDGPVVIEVNRGGSFELPQLVTGKGIMNQDMCDFLESHGWKFAL